MRFTSRTPRCAIAAAALILFTLHGQADSKNPGKVIAGWVEKVRIVELDNKLLKAKLDTGARTSSLHAENIERFKRDGEHWVRFDYTDDDGELIAVERPRTRGVKIKDDSEESGFDRRPVVDLHICFDGRIHEAQFTLTDRSHLVYPVLLGRRFLANIAVIDPEETFLTQKHCEEADEDNNDEKDD